ncbi:MAG: hypothetical protein KJ017_12410 [Alphaproteobacteria bacterium]|nr:hypothetical protein [Alphaproteobacteria bacterium]
MKKSLRRIALSLFVMAAAMGRSPAFACSVKMSSIPDSVILLVLGGNLLAWISLPVALVLWRVKKLKARYTVLPSLLASVVLYAAMVYIHQERMGPAQAMAQCAEMQREGLSWLGTGG